MVGNPPYIRLEAVPKERSDAYRRRASTMGGRADVYIGFYEHGLLSLRDGGALGFICADRWMRNAYGARLRELVASGWSVDAIVSMTGVDAFEEEVDAYPAITVLRRSAQTAGPLVVEGAQELGAAGQHARSCGFAVERSSSTSRARLPRGAASRMVRGPGRLADTARPISSPSSRISKPRSRRSKTRRRGRRSESASRPAPTRSTSSKIPTSSSPSGCFRSGDAARHRDRQGRVVGQVSGQPVDAGRPGRRSADWPRLACIPRRHEEPACASGTRRRAGAGTRRSTASSKGWPTVRSCTCPTSRRRPSRSSTTARPTRTTTCTGSRRSAGISACSAGCC